VRAAHALAVAAVELAVGEPRQLDVSQRQLQVRGDLLAQLRIAGTREEHQSLLGDQLHQSPSSLRSSRGSRWMRRSAQPSSTWAGTPFAIAPGGTSRFTTAPAPVNAPSPTSTGATSTVFDAI